MILVDPRVGTKPGQTRSERLDGIVRSLAAKVNCRVKAAKPMLHSGDFFFEGQGPTGCINIGVEWKTLDDFLGSMRSERLAGDQLVKMSDFYEMVFVIVQGIWKPDNKGLLVTRRGKQWVPVQSRGEKQLFRYSEPFKHMLSLSIRKNIVVLRSSSEDETIWQIADLYAWWQKPWDEHASTDPVKLQTEVTFARVSLLRKMAAELPGIGWTRSAAVDKAFISVQQMVEASVEQWMSIDGIGEKTARRVWAAMREKAL